MRYLSSMKWAGIMTVVCSFLHFSNTSQAASSVLAGWDLFQTDSGGTTFMGQAFAGVPLGNFDFGGSIGLKPVGQTDTIVQRLGGSSAPGPLPNVPIEMLALQLMSVAPFDPPGALPLATYFITLQSSHGGPASSGNIQVTFGAEGANHGTFDSLLDVYFDLRIGALNGPIVFSDHLGLFGDDSQWGHTAPPGAVQIDGVNHNLNGLNTNNDFMPFIVMESHPSGAMHTAGPAQQFPPPPIPFGFSPGMGLALCSGLVGLGHLRRKLACRRSAA